MTWVYPARPLLLASCSLVVSGQPQQQRHGQQHRTSTASKMSVSSLHGRQHTSTQNPMMSEVSV